MKVLNLMIDKNDLKLDAEQENMSAQEIVTNVLKNVILSNAAASKKGLTEDDRWIYYKICDKISECLKNSTETIEFEDAQMKMITNAFKQCALMPQNSYVK